MSRTPIVERRELYRERAMLIAALARHYPGAVMSRNDNREPDWWVIYIETPAGQLSWYIHGDDFELFPWVPVVEPDEVTWDGHSTEVKHERLRSLAGIADGPAGRRLAGRQVRVHVALKCGHEFDETRPRQVVWPVNGELRVCGHPECYPAQFPALYSDLRPLEPA